MPFQRHGFQNDVDQPGVPGFQVTSGGGGPAVAPTAGLDVVVYVAQTVTVFLD